MISMKNSRRQAANPFDIVHDHEFLAALHAQVCARFAVEASNSQVDFGALKVRIGELSQAIEGKELSPEESFSQLARVVGSAPWNTGLSLRKRIIPLTCCESLFLAVYLFDSDTYNDGIEHFFFYDSGDLYDLALEGLREIGCSDVAQHVEAFARSLFGEDYPLDVRARQAVLEASQETADKAADPFRAYARWSEVIARQLALWARQHRTEFISLSTRHRKS
jgi:hypothetical protein